jgi:hypothetical protein
MTKDALKDGVLACIDKVPWLAAEDGNFLTSSYNEWMNPSYNKALVAPFWSRLYRCSDSDVEQLIFFNDARQADMATWSAGDPLDYGLAFGINQGMDIYSVSGAMEKNYDEGMVADEREFTCGVSSHAFAEYVSNWPFPAQNNLSITYAKPSAPVHIMVGTLDANTPVGQSQWIKDAYGPEVDTTIYIVPYASHGLVAPDNLCAADVAADLLSLKTDVDSSCLQTCKPAPDWDGSEEETRDLSMTWFGTRDLWNNGYEVDEITSTDDDDDDDNEDTFSQKEVTNLMIGICVPLSAIIIGLSITVFYLCTRTPRDPDLLVKQNAKSEALF